MKVYNNVMAWNGTDGIILWQSLSGVDIKNNILYQNGHYGIGSYAATGSGVVVDHNLFYGNGSGSYDFTLGGSTYSYTLGTVISSDPRFLNSSASSFDAHLGSGSPAVGVGLDLYSTLTTDMTGAARSSSGAWDLGVYASGSANTPPTISSIANQTIAAGSSSGPLAFTVSDAQTSAANLTVSGNSSQTTLVPTANIVFGGSGSSRTVTITPASGQTGTATITLSVSDGSISSSTSFAFTVNAATAPVVKLGAPVNGASYSAPATINVSANVTANGHTITHVQIYNGGTMLGAATVAPYNFTWSGVSAGSYSLSAKAVYDAGSSVASSSASVAVTNPAVSSSLTFASTSGAITAPFVAASGAISQPAYTSLAAGGQAVYGFNIPSTGNYVVSVLVSAPNTDNNSLFFNIDAQPTDPLMIWDIPPTSGIVSQTGSWRGNGTASSNSPSGLTAQYAPKVFSLAAGTHQLIIRGREANCQLSTITITPTTLSAN